MLQSIPSPNATGECALGQVLIARSVKGVCAVLIGAGRDELEIDLASRFPEAKLVADEAAVHDDLAKVIRFVEKPAEDFISRLTCEGRRSNAAFGRSFARFQWEGR